MYGRSVASEKKFISLTFQFPTSLKIVVKVVAIVMAICSEYYYSIENKFVKILRLPVAAFKYIFNTELLTQRLIEIHKHADICWGKFVCELFESKLFVFYQNMIEHRLAVNYSFKIAPDPMQVDSEKFARLVDIPVPSSHIGIHPVTCRLLSRQHRIGMVTQETRLVGFFP